VPLVQDKEGRQEDPPPELPLRYTRVQEVSQRDRQIMTLLTCPFCGQTLVNITPARGQVSLEISKSDWEQRGGSAYISCNPGEKVHYVRMDMKVVSS
jgi:hypothetical protein